jgi:CheY-like chemotaxis protein
MPNEKILIIDDDRDYRASVQTLLESHNYQVAVASSGTEGLRIIKDVKPDLIVLDIMMETIDEGYGVTQSLKHQPEFEDFKSIPIVMISSIQEDPWTRYGQASGWVEMIIPDQYMTKPLDIPKFLALVERLLRT